MPKGDTEMASQQKKKKEKLRDIERQIVAEMKRNERTDTHGNGTRNALLSQEWLVIQFAQLLSDLVESYNYSDSQVYDMLTTLTDSP